MKNRRSMIGVLLLDDSATFGADRNCTCVTSLTGIIEQQRPDWCQGEDLHLHGLATTDFSGLRVCYYATLAWSERQESHLRGLAPKASA